ncbi:hypothetical protein [Actinomadura monticuli]|uniref:DUF2262 domain-containing protein n=1 Tax=Actinomadura monticuli TaxID=3097367 RepID=A0ABV4QHD5_9ACTN
MSMKLLPVEGALVDAMISLADGPWTRQAVERAFVERGWIRADDVGTVRVPWQTGHEDWPKLDLPAASGSGAGDPDGAGWQLDLGAPPPDEDSGEAGAADHSFVALPFALLWPPLVAEGVDDDGDDNDDEDDLDEDFSAEWIRYPDAGPAEFEAEFRRVRGLVEDRIGPPTRTVGDLTAGWVREIWDRETMALTLSIEDDITTYSHYDHIALGVWSAAAAGKVDGIEDA